MFSNNNKSRKQGSLGGKQNEKNPAVPDDTISSFTFGVGFFLLLSAYSYPEWASLVADLKHGKVTCRRVHKSINQLHW
jgi:hypothetical protein